MTEPDRRKGKRRADDNPKPMYASRTVMCAWVGIVVSVVGVMDPGACDNAVLITMMSSFGAFLFRLMATKPVG